MTSVVAQAYVETFGSVVGLLTAPQVADRWDEPSVLEGMTVADLAAHLGRAVTLTPTFLAYPQVGRAVSACERLAGVAWATSGPHSSTNAEIRRWAHQEAADGPQAVVGRVREAAGPVRDLVEAQDPDRRVGFPAEGVSLSLDDYLLMRLLEIAAHTDDLAASVGVPTPPLPHAAQQALAHLLVDVAVIRHGWLPVLRTLARAERAPKHTISALSPAAEPDL
ncbi:MAG: maleylpyruvate isomerase N-terminal domain-containing protein [Micrococcales bacterium]|nr:maleylpyruvate isomerase N-terminal domain-containing protein [Micrococcales bacterium]